MISYHSLSSPLYELLSNQIFFAEQLLRGSYIHISLASQNSRTTSLSLRLCFVGLISVLSSSELLIVFIIRLI
jgi:hypothetical protein